MYIQYVQSVDLRRTKRIFFMFPPSKKVSDNYTFLFYLFTLLYLLLQTSNFVNIIYLDLIESQNHLSICLAGCVFSYFILFFSCIDMHFLCDVNLLFHPIHRALHTKRCQRLSKWLRQIAKILQRLKMCSSMVSLPCYGFDV